MDRKKFNPDEFEAENADDLARDPEFREAYEAYKRDPREFLKEYFKLQAKAKQLRLKKNALEEEIAIARMIKVKFSAKKDPSPLPAELKKAVAAAAAQSCAVKKQRLDETAASSSPQTVSFANTGVHKVKKGKEVGTIHEVRSPTCLGFKGNQHFARASNVEELQKVVTELEKKHAPPPRFQPPLPIAAINKVQAPLPFHKYYQSTRLLFVVNQGDLSFNRGEVFECVKQMNTGFIFAKRVVNGDLGYVPLRCMKYLSEEKAPAEIQKEKAKYEAFCKAAAAEEEENGNGGK